MSIFRDVRDAVTARDAALRYGLKINRHGMAVCPFHPDKNPSLKIDSRFHCFGCQAHGDAIDFVSLYFGLSLLDAAKKLADDFNIPYDRDAKRPPPQHCEKKPPAPDNMLRDYRTLCSWLRVLSGWKTAYAPRHPDDPMDERYAAALLYMSQLEYVLDDVFLAGSDDDIRSYCSGHRTELDVLRLALAKSENMPEKRTEKRLTA